MSSPRALPTEGPSAGGGDESDDLFDYDIGGEDDPFSESYNAPARPATKEVASNGKSGAGLGIDEEVEVTRKPRAPRVKLDEHKLLSAGGIPKLRKRAKDHLKFKGKGHEYSDASRLLAFYQLWLDDLFPKARFLDALAMVEKMGHKRQMQIARVEWINEGRPKTSVHEDSLFDEPAIPVGEHGGREKTASRIAPIFEKAATERPKTPEVDADAEMDDLYDATPRAARQPTRTVAEGSIGGATGGGSLFGPAKTPVVDNGPPEDDLDALLAEEEMIQAESLKTQAVPIASKATPQESSFDDEEEAMADMDMW
ncbi:Chromosome segregation in meiosis 3 [Hyphodiscus hymeniophilus]|uniref:Chromosome segregation in meiosis protein n=1 Tax=Hyphodiscus hymeniophilus TaxID=353542 RepID=A0A9P6VM38_9HELO|nr:Chromosome segregation in meiosis 3 [Hyphodiscus hymeniophilus]